MSSRGAKGPADECSPPAQGDDEVRRALLVAAMRASRALWWESAVAGPPRLLPPVRDRHLPGDEELTVSSALESLVGKAEELLEHVPDEDDDWV